MNRVGRCGAALAAMVLSGVLPAWCATPLRVGKASPNSSAMLPANVGVQTGIFASHGVDVTVFDFSGGGKLHQAMAAGSIDIGVGAGPEMALIARGSPELAICNATPTLRFLGVMVPANSPAKTVADLKGKRIGVSSIGSLTDWLAQELARKEGWGEQGVRIVAIGGQAAGVIAAFRAGDVDADIGPTALAFTMEYHHEGRLLAPATEFTGRMAGTTIYAAKALIAHHPDAIRRFLAGWFDTVQWMRTHKDQTVKIESQVTGFPIPVESKEYDLTIGMFSRTGRFDAESLANLKRSFVQLHELSAPPDMAKLYTEAFLPATPPGAQASAGTH